MIFRLICCLIVLIPSLAPAEAYRCDEPKGVAMWSKEGHKVSPDGYTGIKPVVIVDDNEMTISWGDTKLSGGAEKVWKAIIYHRSPETVSGVALDDGVAGSAAMLYTIDIKRGYLYLSSHKESTMLNESGAATFISRCQKN